MDEAQSVGGSVEPTEIASMMQVLAGKMSNRAISTGQVSVMGHKHGCSYNKDAACSAGPTLSGVHHAHKGV